MGFNPLQEKGTPIEQQVRNWSELNILPYEKNHVHPFTRARVILMNGIEAEGSLFSHQFARHAADEDLKLQLALIRRIEQQHQKVINWLIPAEEDVLEVTIGYEQVEVDLTAFVARSEPDPYLRAAFDFGLLEDFDHLYRYANLMEMTRNRRASDIVGDYTEITVGRPTIAEHRHPFDEIRRHYDSASADPLSKLHVLTVLSAEQQTMNFYNNVGNRPEAMIGRGLYLEIAQIEEQHVTHYENLSDPTMTWLEWLVLHEYNECYMYHSCMTTEPDDRIRLIWQQHLDHEIEHLRLACDLVKKYERRDPEALLPRELPPATIFQSNKDYVRQVLAAQTDLTAKDTQFVSVEQAPERYHWYQRTVNRGGVPSQQIVEDNIDANGRDYRHETDGPHPVARFRSREAVSV